MPKSHKRGPKGDGSQSVNPKKSLLQRNAPANARTVKSSAKTGTVSRSAAKSAAKAISRAA